MGENLDPKRIIEAALFMSSRPIPTRELGKFCGVAASGYVENKVKELAEEYEKSGSAIKIVKETEGYIMRIRGKYAEIVAPLAQESEISKGALKILAYVYKNDGIKQSEVAERLGSSVYQHIKELVEKGFLEKKKRGRTFSLKTTKKFKDYFSE